MAKKIQTKINIHASPEKIWNVLTNFENYNQWNPFIKSITGTPKQGTQLAVTIQPPGSGKMSFSPKVIKAQENSMFTWKGKLLVQGIFDGEHHFELVPNADGSTTFLHSEKFSGVLVTMVNLEKTKHGFEMMNNALKDYCERN